MTIALLELNDLCLKISTKENKIYSECGFALINESGINTGEEAYKSNWKYPDKCLNNYWLFLDQNLFKKNWRWARHNADIAYAQLNKLLNNAGSSTELILSVPQTFSSEQLSLISGLIKASNTKLRAVVDDSLLASMRINENAWIIDMQLHQTTMTFVEKSALDSGSIFSVTDHETLPNFGFLHICNLLAQEVSNKLIKNSRYDPLHDGPAAQSLFNQIKKNLLEIKDRSEVVFKIKGPSGISEISLDLLEIKTLLASEWRKISNKVLKSNKPFAIKGSAQLLEKILDSSDRYLGIVPDFDIDHVSKVIEKNQSEKNEIVKFESIKTDEKDLSRANTVDLHTATHLLFNNKAWNLDNQLSIKIEDNSIKTQPGINKNSDLAFALKNGRLDIFHCTDSKNIKLPKIFKAGELITINKTEILLIEVQNG